VTATSNPAGVPGSLPWTSYLYTNQQLDQLDLTRCDISDGPLICFPQIGQLPGGSTVQMLDRRVAGRWSFTAVVVPATGQAGWVRSENIRPR
jgi:hypothetical protein